MFASAICSFENPFPGFNVSDVDTDVIAADDELWIDPSTYPAVGKYVPVPEAAQVPRAGAPVGSGAAVAKKVSAGALPGARKAPAAPVRAGSVVLKPKSDGNQRKDSLSAAPKPAKRACSLAVNLPGEAAAADEELDEDYGMFPTEDDLLREIHREREDQPIRNDGLAKTRIITGPYHRETGYGTVYFDIFYQPPRPKETGETAVAINARIHPFTAPPTKEIAVQRKNARKSLLYKIGPAAVAFKVVLNTFNNAGMRHTEKNDWNILWAKRVDPSEWAAMSYYQKVNHFPGTWGVGRKDQLHKNTLRFRKKFGDAFDFTPMSWVIPQDARLLAADMQANPSTTYILKPCASSCGKGIRLITRMPQNRIKSSVVQRYIPNPFLVNNRKFDLRLYVAVTGFDPLKIYIFDEGLCRFAAEQYPGAGEMLENSYAHLTNYSISKTKTLKTEETLAEQEHGDSHAGPRDIKWMLSELKAWFYDLPHGKGPEMWKTVAKQVQDAVVKTFITIETDVCNAAARVCKYPNAHGCFELFGFDMMIDSDLRVYVLEANIMPSLATGNPMDKAVKNRLLAHLLTLVGVQPYDREVVAQAEAKQAFHQSQKEATRTCSFGKSKAFFESLTDGDRRLIIETEAELFRAGGFVRVFPTPKSQERYAEFFDVTRYRNALLSRWEAEKEAKRARMKNDTSVPIPPATQYRWDVPLPSAPSPDW
ncbi:Tubulin polyglutamylase ttll-4 [Diplonema papillatum]|nr:Tubulin polyglutamylase ttll-4 [Diplonema papillatum]